jgi:integrase
MSVHKVGEEVWKIRWREGGHNRSEMVHGSKALARKIERKKMSLRDENRHLDIKREVNFRMTALIDRYWNEYGSKKKSASREHSVIEGIREELGDLFVREVDGSAVDRWYQGLTSRRGLTAGTAVRHFNVMHHMMEKASTIWSKETGIDRNPADQVEVKRPNDQRDRYLSADELARLKTSLDGKMYRQGTTAINRTFYRLRLLLLIALTTGMRIAEIFALTWGDVLYREGLIAVRSKLKGGKMRYVPMPLELAAEIKRFPDGIGEDRIFPPKRVSHG